MQLKSKTAYNNSINPTGNSGRWLCAKVVAPGGLFLSLGFGEDNVDQLYQQALEMMSLAFDVLSHKVGDPQRQPIGGGYVYRYKEKSIYQAVVQKLARVVTGLHAISVLNKAGLLQEQAALQRTLDEFEEDIAFLCFGIIFDDMTDLHREYLAAFYEEEFDDPESAIRSTQKRPMIPRKKIRAFVSKDRGGRYDQSSTIEVGRTVSKLYSGFVHGASPQLMELYFGNPRDFSYRAEPIRRCTKITWRISSTTIIDPYSRLHLPLKPSAKNPCSREFSNIQRNSRSLLAAKVTSVKRKKPNPALEPIGNIRRYLWLSFLLYAYKIETLNR
jgi:hypothetical protein